MSDVTPDDDALRQAPDRLADRKIAAVTVASILVTGAALVVAWVLFEAWTPERRRVAAPPPAPTTIATLEQSLVLHTERGIDLRREQQASLARWEWADRDGGVARIPIDEAIDLLASAPLPVDRALEEPADAGAEGGP